MGIRLLRNKFSRVQNALLKGLIEPDGFGAGGLGDAVAAEGRGKAGGRGPPPAGVAVEAG